MIQRPAHVADANRRPRALLVHCRQSFWRRGGKLLQLNDGRRALAHPPRSLCALGRDAAFQAADAVIFHFGATRLAELSQRFHNTLLCASHVIFGEVKLAGLKRIHVSTGGDGAELGKLCEMHGLPSLFWLSGWTAAVAVAVAWIPGFGLGMSVDGSAVAVVIVVAAVAVKEASLLHCRWLVEQRFVGQHLGGLVSLGLDVESFVCW
mmetsp:Transcript_21079/g.58640  ORF Transcript_21079/g.58640 Transcript_21079/m.58640 type:complete len:207 (+) Transcript_21079:256-876(+)